MIPSERTYFDSYIGFYPPASKWKVSDGIRMMVEVIENNKSPEVILDKYVLPRDSLLKIKKSLSKYTGKNITVQLSVRNDPGKNANGDWVVWVEPKITVKGKRENK
jgi:hypothetical protein